jgi:hypothetical protein
MANRDTFSDLPDALVRDLLAQAGPMADHVTANIRALQGAREGLRTQARHANLIRRKADLDVTREPSVAAVDGSYQIHRLTAVDLCAAAAVAVEGTAREARRHWQEPYHRIWVGTVEHSQNVTNTLRGLMISMELDLASIAPHDLVLLDGSFIVLIIYLNQGLTSFAQAPPLVRDEFARRWREERVLERFLALLRSERTIAVPKYSGRNEFTRVIRLDGLPATDGKTMATLMLEPDEYTEPQPIFLFGQEEQQYHLPAAYCPPRQQDEMNRLLADMRVVFYRPYSWVPAVRLELTGTIAGSRVRLAMALEGIKRQLFSPAVIEPYPLFLADRMVKSLGAGVGVIEQSVTQQAAGAATDVETTMLFLQSHRTEGGRGGV